MSSDRGDRRTREPADDGPYQGTLGRTRTEVVQVWMPDESVRTFPVYVGIDAVADPALAALARGGRLHHVAEGVELAIPFIYHDPALPLLVLVVPETLRHRAVALRAEYMALLASDSAHAVPAYVRDLELVVGARGLTARIAGGRSEPPVRMSGAPQRDSLFEREQALARRERLLATRELALRSVPSDLRPENDAEEVYHSDPGYDGDVLEDELDEDLDEAADDELEEVEDLDDDSVLSADEDSGDFSSDEDDEDAGRSSVTDVEESDVTAVAAPDWFVEDEDSELCLTISNGRVWLLVRGLDAFRGDDDLDVLVRLAGKSLTPVVLVTFVSGGEDGVQVMHGVVDTEDPDQKAALLALTETYEVELMSWSHDESFAHLATLTAARERNVRAILNHLEQHTTHDRELWEGARREVLNSPPPYDVREHPFHDDRSREAPRTATEAAVALDQVAEWLTPERRRMLLLSLCVPDEAVDGTARDVIAFALDWGFALPRHVAARAIELGLEKDEPALLTRRIEGLCRASGEPDYGGLEEAVLRAMWSDALEQAARLGVSLNARSREIAKRHAGERALVHAAALSDPEDNALESIRARALRSDGVDLPAMEELIMRGAHRDVLAVCRNTEQLDVDRAARVFANVARRPDPVALDALLSLLSTHEGLRVRLGAALSLASRHAVSAIDELAVHAAHESGPEWQLFALALGRYGAGSFRAITRALARERAGDERATEVLAHLALHGARAQVRARARSRDPQEASVAQHALLRASDLTVGAAEGKNSAAGLEQQGPLTVFCEMFDRYVREASA
jgi:hypothetical protein